MSFAGKTAVVTGASSGIGRALAVGLAKQGARVGATARRADLLADLVREVRATGGTIEAAPADATDQKALTAAIHELAGKLGPVDLLIANAGVALPSGADPMNVPGVEEMMRVNFLGAVYAFEAVMASMLARGSGHLVAISSLAAFKGLPGSAGYCASKAAIKTYCEGLRIELSARGVAVTCVCPGFIDTPMTKQNKDPMPFLMSADAAAERILRALPGRPGVYSFPKAMRILMGLARAAPDRFIAKRVKVRVASTDGSSK
ncbi:SDR family NAD(P)-dependent oxidoreductase [Fimbriiglobus ruber]|uniref:Oxidoreductase, short-chain dehydrogenase/reductase family n=1 Tax=Fimbriiglobus ruber TaxID=1908690 RepID=A0A225D1Q3_9BACT|nr:SDR family NAD(P)-dependent oxidoreductase [Fimbriiglobus ruber]OWK34853.1 Oxidoreductase, short-chain dehydrogenase/reductase family [Fimbriiglobus ruber]